MSGEYRSDDEAARAKIAALEAELREREAKLSSLLFSRTPAGPFAPMRAGTPQKLEPTQLERSLNLLFALLTVAACRAFGGGSILTLILGAVAYLAFWRAGSALRDLVAHSRGAPAVKRGPEETAAIAALIQDREARVESLQSQITKERAACDDLRKQIGEAELLVNDEPAIKNRESSR